MCYDYDDYYDVSVMTMMTNDVSVLCQHDDYYDVSVLCSMTTTRKMVPNTGRASSFLVLLEFLKTK